MKRALYYLSIGIIVQCCSPSLQSTGGSTSAYSEDLSAHRPKYEKSIDTLEVSHDSMNTEIIADIEPKFDVTDSLNAILDSITVLSKEVKFVDGYTVQVYSGGNREAANIARGKAYTVQQNFKPELTYTAPNFKVHVGQFYSTLEANETFALLKKDFPNAILVLRRFKIERD